MEYVIIWKNFLDCFRLQSITTELDSKFEKYGMETAKDLLAEVTFKLGVS